MDISKMDFKNNNFNCDAALKRATQALSQVGKTRFVKLPGMLKEMAYKGKPGEFQFNHLRIKYFTRDELGMFNLHWLVINAVSGTQKFFYTKDWIGERGNIHWRDMAYKMYKV